MAIVLKAGDTLMAVRGILHRLRNPGNVENHYLGVLAVCGWPFRSHWPYSPAVAGALDGAFRVDS